MLRRPIETTRVTGNLGTGTHLSGFDVYQDLTIATADKPKVPFLCRKFLWGKPKTEEEKHAILFAATILSARKIVDSMDAPKPNPGKDFFVERAIKEAVAILEKIDQRWLAEW